MYAERRQTDDKKGPRSVKKLSRPQRIALIRRPQSVADSGLRQDVMRVRGVALEFAPEVADVDSEEVGFLGIAWSPDPPQELLMGQHPPAGLDEGFEQLVFGGGQAGGAAGDLDVPTTQIDFQIPVPKRFS